MKYLLYKWLLCPLGFHTYKERRAFQNPDIEIYERVCIYCDYCSTWER